ncbi:hypothetical protein RJG79_04620 [Mycoplasmatota bacterium WC44]
MERLQKKFWSLVVLYYIVDVATIITTGFDYQALVRTVLAALLFYFVYLGKNWARILWLVLLWISVIFGAIGLLFSMAIGYEGTWLFFLMLAVNVYSIYILSSKNVKLVFKRKISLNKKIYKWDDHVWRGDGLPEMSVEEAKDYYKFYNGNGYSMFREHPFKYSRYDNMNFPTYLEHTWSVELFNEKYERIISNNAERVWCVFDSMFECVSILKSPKYLNLLYEVLEYITNSNDRLRIAGTLSGISSKPNKAGCIYLANDMGETDLLRKFASFVMECTMYETSDRAKEIRLYCLDTLNELSIDL